MKNQLLTFGKGNAKLNTTIATFSIPAGSTCPFAHDCKSMVIDGKIQDGPFTKFRCFSASQEVLFPAVRKSRLHNLSLLKGNAMEMAKLISVSLPKQEYIRVHVSGDFFSQAYFDAWMLVAKLHPEKKFYAYTKSLRYWVTRKNEIPANFSLVASVGGSEDYLIGMHNLVYARVVNSEAQAKALGLEIDNDDSHAIFANKKDAKPFALLLHGTQPKGSEAAKALSELKKAGHTGYNAKNK